MNFQMNVTRYRRPKLWSGSLQTYIFQEMEECREKNYIQTCISDCRIALVLYILLQYLPRTELQIVAPSSHRKLQS